MDFLDEAPKEAPQAEEQYQPPAIPDAMGGFGFTDEAPAPAAPAAPAEPVIDEPVGVPSIPVGGVDHMAKFRAEAQATLAKRDAEADEQHAAIRQKATDTIAKMKADRDAMIQSRHTTNQDNEKTTKAQNDALFSDGPIWDRVISLVDFSADEKLSRKTARMREILKYKQAGN